MAAGLPEDMREARLSQGTCNLKEVLLRIKGQLLRLPEARDKRNRIGLIRVSKVAARSLALTSASKTLTRVVTS